LIARIVSLLDSREWNEYPPGVARHQIMMLHFAAGKALDDLGDHSDAMHHFGLANTVRRQLCSFNVRSVEHDVDRLVSRFTPQCLAENASLGQTDSTPILIVGMPRSGTTLVERIVSSHSEIYGRGEVDFWNNRGPAVRFVNSRVVEAGDICKDYLRVLRRGGAPGIPRATDKMPFNFFWVGLIHLLFPNARIIHVHRNPIDTCLSNYMTPIWAPFASDLRDLASYYLQYRRIMTHWRDVVPSNRLLDVEYEEMVADPEACARRLIAFCGLEWDPNCAKPERNQGAVSTASHWQARQPIYRSSVERWRRYEPWIGELKELL
jgi:hypothetical protein